jgi:hypothetical protein
MDAELRRATRQEPTAPKMPALGPMLAGAGGTSAGTFSAAAAAMMGRGSSKSEALLASIDARLKDQNQMMEDEESGMFE